MRQPGDLRRTGRRESASSHPRRSCRGHVRLSVQERYFFACFSVDAFFPLPLPSSSSALRTSLNSSSDALSALGNFRSSVSSALTIAEPITTRANHLWSAGTTYHGATAIEV